MMLPKRVDARVPMTVSILARQAQPGMAYATWDKEEKEWTIGDHILDVRFTTQGVHLETNPERMARPVPLDKRVRVTW